MSDSIYLDYNATTPVDPRVIEAMLPFFSSAFGNAASGHSVGRAARAAVDAAREKVATGVGGRPSHVVFTSGATESNNLAIKGTILGSSKRRRIITFATEHKATLDASAAAQRFGATVTVLPVHANGVPDVDALAESIDDHTAIVSVMAANNETGVLAPLADILALAHRRGALAHCDATQAVGKIPFDLRALPFDLVSFSAHKLYGPQGVGALIIDPEVTGHLEPLIHGGGHERGLRSGTLNTAGCVGFGEAVALALDGLPEEMARLELLRTDLELLLDRATPGTIVNGIRAPRLPGTTNIRFPGIDGDALMLAMPELAVSSGSACTSASLAPSHVLIAMGLSHEEADQCIRFSLGRFTTEAEIKRAAELTRSAIDRLLEVGVR